MFVVFQWFGAVFPGSGVIARDTNTSLYFNVMCLNHSLFIVVLITVPDPGSTAQREGVADL